MSCKHTIGTAVDWNGCCVSCGADLNPIAIVETRKKPGPGPTEFTKDPTVGCTCCVCTAWRKDRNALLAEIDRLTAENDIGNLALQAMAKANLLLENELKAKNKQLATAIRQRNNRYNLAVSTYAELKVKEERIDKMENALRQIDTWAKAYPLNVYPKPDLKKAAEVLKASGMNLDSISADNMRHVLDGIKDIVREALKEKP